MRGARRVTIAASLIFVALSGTPALAAHPRHAPTARHCCRVPAGTEVEVQLVEQVGTKAQTSGDAFAIRLAAPLIVHGEVVLASGTPGVGVVVESARPGVGGK